jgi:hypothetical protein
MSSDDFYIGYLPKAPSTLGRRIAWTAAGLIAIGLAIGFVLIGNEPTFADSRFEFGVYRDYNGVIEEWPYPILHSGDSTFLLVAPGKHGFSEAAKGWQGKTVQLRGSLIERRPNQMLQVVPDSMREAAVNRSDDPPKPIGLGPVTLRGEIVDSKCYLGVMNPGNGKVHRDCAVRCISGGAPPAFVAQDSKGDARVMLLVGSDGRQLRREVLPFVAEPIEVAGELVRSGTTLVLKAEPSHFRRAE